MATAPHTLEQESLAEAVAAAVLRVWGEVQSARLCNQSVSVLLGWGLRCLELRVGFGMSA